MPPTLDPGTMRQLFLLGTEQNPRPHVEIAAEIGVSPPTVGNYLNRYPLKAGDRPIPEWPDEELQLARALARNPHRRPAWLAQAMGRNPRQGARIADRLKTVFGGDFFEPSGDDEPPVPETDRTAGDDGDAASPVQTSATSQRQEQRKVGPDSSTSEGSNGSRVPPVDEGDVTELRVVEIGDEGDGLAFIDGFSIFVPGTQIGDHVRARITSVGSRFGFAEVEEHLGWGRGWRDGEAS